MTYLKNSLKFALLFISFLVLIACPRSDNITVINTIPNLVLLSPINTTYNKGDLLILKLIIPSKNTYFGNEINIFEKTHNYEGKLVLFSASLFIDNNLNFIKGFQGENSNWLYAVYNPENENYELDVEITLNRTGNYSFSNGAYVYFDEHAITNYMLTTNYLWSDSQNLITFTVI